MGEIAGEKLLLPDSFVYAGLSEFIDKLVEPKSRAVAREYYSDVDMLYLKVQTDHYIAFSSGLNNIMFGDRLAIVPLVDIDSSFKVSAFYHDDFIGETFSACREGFEFCQKAMGTSGGSSIDLAAFSLANFG